MYVENFLIVLKLPAKHLKPLVIVEPQDLYITLGSLDR